MSKKVDRTVFRRASDKKWVDKRNSASRGFVYDTQAAAIAAGRKRLVNAGGGEQIIMGVNGEIRSKDTIGGGNDPVPPRDKEH